VSSTPVEPLASLGWDASYAAAFETISVGGLVPARVIAEHRSGYVIAAEAGERPAVLAGRLRHDASDASALPAVGDWVAAVVSSDGTATIRAVLPRRSAFLRKAAGAVTEAQVVAANVDVALIATALPDDLNPRRLERYLTVAWESGAMPVVLLTKADLCPDLPAALAKAHVAAPGAEVVAVSAATGFGVDKLARWIAPGRTAVILGSSGVGKSTLVNRLAGRELLATADVRDDGKGRHTTTHRQLVRLTSGALLIDTPGMRELQLWSDGSGEGLASAFADVESLAEGCRFRDCSHRTEPGCAVLEAIASGDLPAERFASWRALGRELAWLELRQDQAAAAEAKAQLRTFMRSVRMHVNQKKNR
jgi:ribosome biogenesis GTPase / thiamine phosphate phosphatase